MKVLNAIKEKIKDWDKLGDEFKITQDKREQYSTVFGGLLTIVAYIFAIGIITTFIRQYFKTTDPDVSEMLLKSKKIPKIDLYEIKHAPFVQIRSGAIAVPVEDYSKYFTIVMASFTVDRDGTDLKFTYKTDPLVPCSEADPVLYSRVFEDTEITEVLKYSYCLKPTDPKQYYIESNVLNSPYRS